MGLLLSISAGDTLCVLAKGNLAHGEVTLDFVDIFVIVAKSYRKIIEKRMFGRPKFGVPDRYFKDLPDLRVVYLADLLPGTKRMGSEPRPMRGRSGSYATASKLSPSVLPRTLTVTRITPLSISGHSVSDSILVAGTGSSQTVCQIPEQGV